MIAMHAIAAILKMLVSDAAIQVRELKLYHS